MINCSDRLCELCKANVFVYCASDEAFLCLNCDAYVHHANFLADRHARHIICSKCKVFTGKQISGYFIPSHCCDYFCADCYQDNHHHPASLSLSSASESDCASSTVFCVASQTNNDDDRRPVAIRSNSSQSPGKVRSSHNCIRGRNRMLNSSKYLKKVEEVLVKWCSRLELTGHRAARLAKNALAKCWNQMSVLPLRVSLAAALWLGIKICLKPTDYRRQMSKRLEEISGVQDKIFSVEESKLERALIINLGRRSLKNDHQAEEGSEESTASC